MQQTYNKFKFYKKIVSIITIVLLNGCASTSKLGQDNKSASWTEQKKHIQQLIEWDIKGKIAFSDGSEGGSANITWLQQNKYFDINIFGPFKTESMTISGKPGDVSFTTTKGVEQTASSAEEIILQQLGWTVPISGLIYWARGIPVPHSPIDDIQVSNDNTLTYLKQQGWSIEYHDYKAIDNYVLPTKITLRYKNIKIKLIFKSWF